MKIENNVKIDDTAVIFPGAHIIGDVEIGENVSIWYNAVLRGDVSLIKIGKNSNVQDNCVVHGSKDCPTIIKDNVSVGHGAVVHGCKIEDNVIIGMNSTVLNNAHIGKNSIVGAGAVVSEGKTFPDNSLILGIPAKAVKTLSGELLDSIKENSEEYVKLSKSYEF